MNAITRVFDNRAFRKGLVELALSSVVAVLSLVLDNPELGLGSYTTFILLQLRRAARDAAQGAPK
jgi:hypothetical protein